MNGGCAVNGCNCDAAYVPVLVLLAPAEQDPLGEIPAFAHITLGVCEKHKATLTLTDFITDENWEKVLVPFKATGCVMPDRERTTLKFEPLA